MRPSKTNNLQDQFNASCPPQIDQYPMTITLPNQAISLRDWQITDLDRYKSYHAGEQEWMKYNGPYYPQVTQEELEKQLFSLEQRINSKDWPTPRRKLVITDASNQFIGTVSWYWQSKETHWLSIGLIIYDQKNWSKGFGYQALRIWGQYLFDQNQDLARLDLRTWSGNGGMIKLGTKLGFAMEARFRNARIVNGKYFDSIGMGILRDEWPHKQLVIK